MKWWERQRRTAQRPPNSDVDLTARVAHLETLANYLLTSNAHLIQGVHAMAITANDVLIMAQQTQAKMADLKTADEKIIAALGDTKTQLTDVQAQLDDALAKLNSGGTADLEALQNASDTLGAVNTSIDALVAEDSALFTPATPTPPAPPADNSGTPPADPGTDAGAGSGPAPVGDGSSSSA